MMNVLGVDCLVRLVSRIQHDLRGFESARVSCGCGAWRSADLEPLNPFLFPLQTCYSRYCLTTFEQFLIQRFCREE